VSTTGPRLRPDLESLPSYKAGQRPQPRSDITTYKISSNESHHAPLASVQAAIVAAAAEINRYPDPFSRELVATIANHFGVPAQHIALGTGSVALCGQIIQSAAGLGDNVMYAWRSFESYPIWTGIAGAQSIQIPLKADETHDLDAMFQAVTPETRVIFICSPNNPTGQIVDRLELEEFIAKVPGEIVIVLDEAYLEYVPEEKRSDSIRLYREHSNIVVLRTFSKAYGLAGLRVGFTISQEPITNALNKTAMPFGVSSVAQAAAIASINAESELFERVASVVVERDRVARELEAIGYHLSPSYANFIWMRLGSKTDVLHQALERAGLSVRPFPGEGVRISIGETEANDRFIEVARQVAVASDALR
jgi:histidinol-phosphate aminotransferase